MEAGSRMSISIRHADAAIFDVDGNLALVIDIKNKRGTDVEWATGTRRNMMAHGFLHPAPFFLLALPDRFYLWKDAGEQINVGPTYDVDPTTSLASYSETLGIYPQELSTTGFEFFIVAWFQSLLRYDELPQELVHLPWLVRSGLWERIRRGTLVSDTAQ